MTAFDAYQHARHILHYPRCWRHILYILNIAIELGSSRGQATLAQDVVCTIKSKGSRLCFGGWVGAATAGSDLGCRAQNKQSLNAESTQVKGQMSRFHGFFMATWQSLRSPRRAALESPHTLRGVWRARWSTYEGLCRDLHVTLACMQEAPVSFALGAEDVQHVRHFGQVVLCCDANNVTKHYSCTFGINASELTIRHSELLVAKNTFRR